MRISKQSARSAPALFLAVLATAALAQDSKLPSPPGQGDAAMERLKAALLHAKDAPVARDPVLLSPPTDETRRRAVDALRSRATSSPLDERARAALAAGEAKMVADREAMAKRLRESLGLEPAETDAVAKVVAPAPTTWVPVLFVSSSIPVPILRAYAAQLERAHGVLAFRGMPGGLHRVGPMAKLTAEILRLDPGCEGPSCAMRGVQVIIDPIVFRQHGVTRVPALAMLPGDPTQPYCERDDDSPRARFTIYGDSALTGLLDEYARLGGREEVRNAQALLGTR